MDRADKNFLGSGWAFPVMFSGGNHQLKVTAYEDNINDSIRVILRTNRGERCMEPNFGAGLQQFFFRKMEESLKIEIKDAVKVALLLNEPRITVDEVDVVFTDLLAGWMDIKICYEYNQSNTRHNYVFPFSIKEGSNLRLKANE